MVEGLGTFERYDLVITRGVHDSNVRNGVYTSNLPDLDIYPELKLKEESVPKYGDLIQLLKDVGEKYGWDRRREFYDPESKKEIIKQLKQSGSRRFTFMAGQKEVGGCIVANIEPEEQLRELFTRAGRLPQYSDLKPETAANTVEIYKIGLKDQYTRHGWGKYFLGELLTTLFDESKDKTNVIQNPDAVYLNTRSTNHNRVVNFYKDFNMNMINGMTYPDDLISLQEIVALLQQETPRDTKKPRASAPIMGPSVLPA